LIPPDEGLIYLDANCFIYSVEHIEPYGTLLEPVWRRGGIVTSEITRLEVLVKPFQAGDEGLAEVYRQLLNASEVECLPLSAAILKQAARLRAATGIKTPDAIHAASSLARNAVLFLSNDKQFRNIPSLPFAYLHDQAGG
jgi:predicted nucleic acid-binding protein